MLVGQEDKPSLDELAHFGVRGMKWGVRRASSQPAGVSRFGGAKIQANNRMIDLREKAQKGFIGKRSAGYRDMQNREIAKLQDSNKRIMEGHKKIQDVLNIYSTVGLSDLLFTKTPTKK